MSSSSNKDAHTGSPPPSDLAADGAQQVSEDVAAGQSKNVELEQLLESDFEMWLRHFGAC
jgi:hypothetical protein